VAEQLIENEAEFQLYANIIMDNERAAVCDRLRKEALATLRNITKDFNGVSGKIKPTRF
jgi:hypothetical protein